MFTKTGDVRPLGLSKRGKNINAAFVSAKDDCGLVIYDFKTRKEVYRIPFPKEARVGNIHAMEIEGLGSKRFCYQFYEENTLIKDTYAKAFVGNEKYGEKKEVLAVFPNPKFDWGDDANPRVPYEDALVYLLHVRGFTKHPSSKVKSKGTFRGVIEKLNHLKELGITTLELQPAYEFDEADGNYWGYTLADYFSPKNSYAQSKDGVKEFKEMVKALHAEGIEVVMQFYFPNQIPEWDVLEILRHWITEYHVDGFHIKGNHLAMERIKEAPALADTKLWFTHFEQQPLSVYDKQKEMNRTIAVYNQEYCFQMRGLLKGDEGRMESCAKWMRLNPAYAGQINFLTNYDMFTLQDLVSYDRKHNEANGENNKDGNDYNCSWNCGVEGPTKKKQVTALRKKQMRNALCLLMLSQGTPLIFMGDEFGNSQEGNNNPYNQDNEIGWINWSLLEKNREILEFFKELSELRRNHPVLHPKEAFRLMDYISCGYPDLSYHGEEPWKPCFEYHSRQLGVLLCGKYAKINRRTEDDFFYIAYNLHWEEHSYGLPDLPKDLEWKLKMSTDEEVQIREEKTVFVNLPPRSIAIFTSKKRERK
ncbi:MAG: hypothetical protein IJW63_10275 [Lachnospiraceae bacterium]|nr:hypothetical protein [Lachnospiraceae bacterium]